MAELIDLGLVGEAKRVLEKLVDKRGIRWFLASEGPRLMALDATKIDLVVRTAERVRRRRGQRVIASSREQCRTQVRRALIQRVAIAMLKTGC
jgi:hypothetical protein